MKFLAYFSIILVVVGVGLVCLGVLQSAQASTKSNVSNADSGLIFPNFAASDASNHPSSNENRQLLMPEIVENVERDAESENHQDLGQVGGGERSSVQNMDLLRIDQSLSADRNIPDRIVIPIIGLDAPIEPSRLFRVKVSGYFFDQWAAPDHFAAGWHQDSADLGKIGNTVINGHHNNFGEVFRKLIDLKVGNSLFIYSRQNIYTYAVNNIILVQEYEVTLRQRIENARWISPTKDERITLITCWPYESNTHRLIIVASPVR